ncbi:MAG: PLP-dependent aminotransferase family protein [Clostridiales bacterium]|jgi:2-aminoadipate transaminase|nr:PLP-dependent aminotransferase family protein [Clostridiales bacterium]
MVSFAKRMDGITGSIIREIFKLLADPEIISFGGGNPAKESFPLETVKAITREILDESGAGVLQYGTTEGYSSLPRSYITHIAQKKGLTNLKEDNILITCGSSQGLDLTARVFVDPGDVVLVESPTFLGTLQMLNTYQAKLVPVRMDDEGADINDLEEKVKKYRPKMFYVIPTFQNPTGKTLGRARRESIARLAEKYDFIVMEDDPYGDLRYRGEPLPPIKSFDSCGNVVMLNSFSKILSPGLRVGVAVGDPAIIRKMTVAKQSNDAHTSNLTQAIADAFLKKGLLPGHLAEILPMYTRRLDAMLTGIDAYFPETFTHTSPEGGLFVWGELAGGLDMPALLKAATSQAKVAFIPGQYFYLDPAAMGQNTMRLNFSAAAPERITEGLERLGKLIKNAL